MSTETDKLLDAQGVADLLQVSRQWVYDHTPRNGGKPARRRPALPVMRVGGVIRYRESRVRQILEQCEQTA